MIIAPRASIKALYEVNIYVYAGIDQCEYDHAKLQYSRPDNDAVVYHGGYTL